MRREGTGVGVGGRSAHTLDRLPSPWKEERKPQRQF